ncbi:MAG TPA: CerR family C-terminal domain-containing protein [Candidatus Acidoferrum sp.]|nr:CerR family C-terminal domain-containing protein [Candidatus Acidoferrum sp.]
MDLKPQPPPEVGSPDETRRQLLEAAGAVFAAAGFRQATVREICRRAGANIAAVNYHFGDKETLYAEVLRYSQQQAFEKYPLLPGIDAATPAPVKLHAFVRSFLLRISDPEPTAWFGKMMLREMIEPTGALEALLEERIRPMAAQLGGIVAEILGRSPDDERVRLCSLSIVSQCVFYHHCRRVVAQLFPEQTLNASTVEPLADHITRFSLAAMRHLPEPEKAKRRSRRLSAHRR